MGDTTKSFNSWLSAFNSLKIDIKYEDDYNDDDNNNNDDVNNNNDDVNNICMNAISLSSSITSEIDNNDNNDNNDDNNKHQEELKENINIRSKYDEEDERLLEESKRLEQLLKK